METKIGKLLRLNDIIDSRDNHALWIDTTSTSSIGAIPNLEDVRKFTADINEISDAIIVNPGQAEKLADLLGGKRRASPIVRVDWTNAYRGEDFCLPPANMKRVEISNGEDVLRIGGSAAAATLFLGYDEECEANNIRSISRLCRESYPLSLPVVADIRPIGPKVNETNFDDVIKLGVSFMMEAGADVIVIPECKAEIIELVTGWSTVPVVLRVESAASVGKFAGMIEKGLCGLVLSEAVVDATGLKETVANSFQVVHPARVQ
jgi:DhnA family fructose-bisphosphate aldolase class Ia